MAHAKTYRAMSKRLHEEADAILGEAKFRAEEKRKEARQYEERAQALDAVEAA